MEPQKVLHLHLEEAKKKPDLQQDYMITEKLDGWYTTIDHIAGKGWGQIRSSSGRVIPSMEKLHEIFQLFPSDLPDCRLIMEATIPGKDFYETNGIFNRSVGDYLLDPSLVRFNLHDFLLLGVAETAVARHTRLGELLREMSWDNFPYTDMIKAVPLLGIANEKKIWMHYAEKIWNEGGEGVVLKRANSFYCPGKRNATLMKIKLEEEFDLLCTKLYQTVGEKGYSNLNMSLVNKAGVSTEVRIGAFTDVTAFSLESPVGKVITIKCMKANPDGTYREPRFKCVRYDKLSHEID